MTQARLQERYHKEIVPALAQKFGRENRLSLPKLTKIVINMGVGKALQDKNRMSEAVENLGQIAANIQSVTIVLTVIPILCVYPFVQKYFFTGVMLGSVKE